MTLKSRFVFGPDTVFFDPKTGKATRAGLQLINDLRRFGSIDRYVSTADGSDAATTQALANALKAAHNAAWTG